MRNILLTISYDGTDFCGWQRQDKGIAGKPARTVQGEIEKSLEVIHKTHVDLAGSGRTDSGVHAMAQAANFMSPVDTIPAENYVRALNSLLPPDIRIMASREVPAEFHSRFNATSRTYRYFICPGLPAASEMRFVWPIFHSPDVVLLNKMAACLHGETDCAAFAAAGDKSLSTKRYIESCRFFEENGKVVFEICANAFLWKMVRSLTGTFIFLEKTGRSEKDFLRILASRDRTLAGPTAPPEGLFLWSVGFDGVRRHV